MTLPKGYKTPNEVNNSIVKVDSELFSRPIADTNLLEIRSYDIDVLKGVEEYPDLDTMDVRPIEADASILFYNKKKSKGVLLTISKIKDIKITDQRRGGFF